MKKLSRCPVCQQSDVQLHSVPTECLLVKCSTCDMVWDSKPPANITDQYREDYFVNSNPKGGYANYFAGMTINSKTFAMRLQRLEKRLGKKGYLLDVGCALGDCLVEAKKLGWKHASGLEISAYASAAATRRGVKVKQGVLQDLIDQENWYDVITMQDVIEHVTDPVTHLEHAYRLLKPGGVLFIVTPDIGGIWSKLLGKHWYHYKPGEHVVYFSQASMRHALAKVGFTNIQTRKTYHVMSAEYIVNRLRYYAPKLFSALQTLVEKTPIKRVPFRVYSGELEAWAFK